MLMDPTEKWRFINILSLLFILMTFIFDFCFFYLNFPDKNRDILVGIANIINSGGIITILNYFYGSSKSSDGKDKVITSLVNSNSLGNEPNGNSQGNQGSGQVIVNPPATVEVKMPQPNLTTTTTLPPSSNQKITPIYQGPME
jgi:hypothetical protein